MIIVPQTKPRSFWRNFPKLLVLSGLMFRCVETHWTFTHFPPCWMGFSPLFPHVRWLTWKSQWLWRCWQLPRGVQALEIPGWLESLQTRFQAAWKWLCIDGWFGLSLYVLVKLVSFMKKLGSTTTTHSYLLLAKTKTGAGGLGWTLAFVDFHHW